MYTADQIRFAVSTSAQFVHLSDGVREDFIRFLSRTRPRWFSEEDAADSAFPAPLRAAMLQGLLAEPLFSYIWVEKFAARHGVTCCLCGGVERNGRQLPAPFVKFVAPKALLGKPYTNVPAPICCACLEPMLKCSRRLLGGKGYNYDAFREERCFVPLIAALTQDGPFKRRIAQNKGRWKYTVRRDPRAAT